MAEDGMRVRMAMALFENDQRWRGRVWAHAPRSVKSMFLADADAVVVALFEPTDAMLEDFGIHKARMRLNWHAMINVIKAERFADPGLSREAPR